MKSIRNFVILALLAVGSSFTAAYYFTHKNSAQKEVQIVPENNYFSPVKSSGAGEISFVEASKQSRSSVVFIKTEASVNRRGSFWFFDFDPFGNIGKVSSTGSGVILTSDGYIVTNNHVISNADKIEVFLNNSKRTYQAKVIGRAPSSDLALIKIEAENLKAIEVANSDELEIGEWVLAVGNPFNLTSTVTAGIVSAKGRNINIMSNQFPIESFIQTDAAINPGNSGGALVDLAGKLVGVNTAIASKTGSYVGYGFAIPSNIVIKIINDLREYGQIQQAFDGLEIIDITEEISTKVDENQEGAFISAVSESHNSAKNKLQPGDIIIAMDNITITNKAEYDERLALRRPGETVTYTIIRNDDKTEADIRLENKNGTYKLSRRVTLLSETLGAEFEMISKVEREIYGVDAGIKVSNVKNGTLRKMNIPEGFIFTALNNKKVRDLESFVKQMENVTGQVRIEGVSPQGGRQILSFYVR